MYVYGLSQSVRTGSFYFTAAHCFLPSFYFSSNVLNLQHQLKAVFNTCVWLNPQWIRSCDQTLPPPCKPRLGSSGVLHCVDR